MFLKADITQLIRWDNVMASAYLEKKIRPGEQITYDVEYLYYHNNSPSEVFNSVVNKDGHQIAVNDSLFSPHQKGPSEITIHVGVFKIDYSRQLSKKVKLEAGVKGTFTKSAGYSGIQSMVDGNWQNVYGKSSNVSMKEGIGAGYISVNAELSPSTTLTAGARYEYSDTRLYGAENDKDVTDRKLGKLFPTIYLTHKLDDNSNLQLSYTKRISRPSYNDLASFITYLDPIAVFSGNPLLRPTITNNLKMAYNYLGYSFSVLLGRDDNPIARYQTIANPAHDLMYISPENLAYQNNLIFELKLPWKPVNWWDMNYGFVGGWKDFKMEHTPIKAEKTYFGYSAYATHIFKLPKSWSVEIAGWYNSLAYNGSIKGQGFGVVNGGVKKDLKNEGGTLQFSVSDIFKTTSFHNSLGSLTQEAFGLQSYLNFNPESRRAQIFKLTYTRSFGSSKGSAGRTGDAGSKDEQERIRKN
jgi:outer membrane receptor protein involved in Fe transport